MDQLNNETPAPAPAPASSGLMIGRVDELDTTKKIAIAVVIFILLLLIIRLRNSNFTVSRMPSFNFNSFRDNFKMRRDCKCKK